MSSRSRSRLRRWARRVLLGIAGVLVLAVVGALVVVHSLDRPWVKTRVQAFVRANAGVDIDYAAARVRVLDGIEIDDLVVRSAPAFRDLAPELAHVRHVDARWTMALFTRGHVERVSLDDVSIVVAIDGEGKTSVDGLGPPPSPTPSPKTPLSRQTTEALASAPPVSMIDVTKVSFTLVQKRDAAGERTSLRGVDIHARAESVADAWHLRLDAGVPERPLELDVARDQAGDAHARFWLTADIAAREAKLALDLDVPKQSFVDAPAVPHVLHAEARATFDPVAKKTSIALEHTAVADGIATADAQLELPDDGPPRLHRAEGQIDFVRLLALVPEALLPVRASIGVGRIHYRVDDLALDALPKVNPEARVAVDGELADVKIAPAVEIAKAKLDVHLEPAANADLHARADVVLDGKVADATASQLHAELDATQAADATTGTLSIAFQSVTTPALDARDGKLGLRVDRLVVDRKALLGTHGGVVLDADVANVDLHTPAARVVLERVRAKVHAEPTGHAPWAVAADVAAASSDVHAAGRPIVHAPMHVALDAREIVPDEKNPRASLGKGSVVADVGNLHVRLDADKLRDGLAYEVDATAPTTELARPFVPKDAGLPLDRMALSLRSKGHVEAIFTTPSLAQHLVARLDRPSAAGASAEAILLAFDSSGTASRHEVKGDLRARGLAFASSRPADEDVLFDANVDLQQNAVGVHLDASGQGRVKLAAALGFDPARRAVTYDISGSAHELAPLAPFAALVHGLEGFDLSHLEIGVAAKGAMAGVVTDVQQGVVHVVDAPERTIEVDGTIDVHAKNVAWSRAATSMSAPAVDIALVLRGEGDVRTIESRTQIGEFHLASGLHTFEVAGLEDHSTASVVGDLLDPELRLEQSAAVNVVKQDLVPSYSLGQITTALGARRSRDGIIHVAKAEVANGAGGTSLSLRGAIDPTELQRRFSLRGELRQDLSRLSNTPGLLVARGQATVALRVESPDLSIFRTVADVRLENGELRLPRSGVVVEDADGEIPITVSVRVAARGVQLIRDDQDNPYSSLRFTDQHPLMSRNSFISIKRLVLPQVTISPIVGNLQIEQNLISLRQFEIGVRNGRVTGQCALDWNGDKSTFGMHIRADGVQSSHGEPFTGSAALEVSAGEHSIAGRADVLKIGKRHLLDLLDIQDPFHADAGINKIRSALSWGYPDKLRLTFDHGFASVHVGLGGLARFVSIDDLRGIPMGPIIDRLLIPILPRKDEP